MTHPICRVLSFEIVAPHTLRVVFDDATEQVIDFEPFRGESCAARFAISPCSIGLQSIPRRIRSYGRTGLISTPRLFTTGLSAKRPSWRWPRTGSSWAPGSVAAGRHDAAPVSHWVNLRQLSKRWSN